MMYKQHFIILPFHSLVSLSSVWAVALAAQSSPQIVKHGNTLGIKVAGLKPNSTFHVIVSSQPHAAT